MDQNKLEKQTGLELLPGEFDQIVILFNSSIFDEFEFYNFIKENKEVVIDMLRGYENGELCTAPQ